jgi:hypothetical protein
MRNAIKESKKTGERHQSTRTVRTPKVLINPDPEAPFLELAQFLACRRYDLGHRSDYVVAEVGMTHAAALSRLESGYDDPRISFYMYPKNGRTGLLALYGITAEEALWFVTWSPNG